MFDIPLGDALLLKTPHGKIVFIDGGDDESVLAKLDAALPFWQKHIDILLITHPDLDHLAGGLEILKKYTVGTVLLTGVATRSGAFQDFSAELERRTIPIRFVTAQDDFVMDGVKFDVLFPENNLVGAIVPKTNNTSIVLRLEYGAISLLLTGDIEAPVENTLLALPNSLKTSILKVAHHGSKTSSSEAFLAAVHPELALISAAQGNRFGHPHAETTDRLKNDSIPTVITRDHGDIELLTTGKELSVHTAH